MHDRQKDDGDPAWDALTGDLKARLGAGELLDAGAGSGLLTARLSRLGVRVVALDFNWSMLEVLLERVPVPVVMGDVSRLPCASASFGGVLISNVLHLLVDWRGALSEAARVVRPGGALMLSLGSGMGKLDGASPLSATARHFRSLVPLDGRGEEQDPASENEVLEALDALGLVIEEPCTASGHVEMTLRSVVERLQHNVFGWPHSVEQPALDRAAIATLGWAHDAFGSIDEPTTVTTQPSVIVARRRK